MSHKHQPWDALANDPRFLEGIGADFEYSRMVIAFAILHHSWTFASGELKVLDLGCGPGVFLDTLMKATKEHQITLDPLIGRNSQVALSYFGIDSSPAMIEEARRRHRAAADRFQVMPTENIPDQAFDYVVVRHVLEHQENPFPLLSELKRITKRKLWIAFSPSEATLGATVDWATAVSARVDTHLGVDRYVHPLPPFLIAFLGELQMAVTPSLQPHVFSSVMIQRLPLCEVILCATRQ